MPIGNIELFILKIIDIYVHFIDINDSFDYLIKNRLFDLISNVRFRINNLILNE